MGICGYVHQTLSKRLEDFLAPKVGRARIGGKKKKIETKFASMNCVCTCIITP